MSRFFVPQKSIRGSVALITGAEAHHVLDVMRLKKGDEIQFFDGTGKVYFGHIVDVHPKQLKVEIENVWKQTVSSRIEVTLVQSLPRKNKIEYIIEKCTELGIQTIIPTQTARTVVRLDKQKISARLMRWRKIAQEAAKQCGRTELPKVDGLLPWVEILSLVQRYDLKLLPCLSGDTRRLKDVLRNNQKAEKIVILVGPEGGFTAEERNQACSAGCIPVSLANQTLKSDTAAISALTMVNYELGG
ncbi:MAG: 16S rRNA (uracil(1498)-N(3))-methyltransferase [Candidatus Omnitrophica bacterium]|nr:16S rRNA (uracil(1498)-N(3))-methyltransferase [Candidatus Omnitrophota bacterium]